MQNTSEILPLFTEETLLKCLIKNLSKMKKNRILGALSIELVEKGNNQYVISFK